MKYIKILKWSLQGINGIFVRNITTSFRCHQQVMNLFDKDSKILQKKRSLLTDDVDVYDYLKDEVANRLADRIFDIDRNFSNVLDLGCGRGYLLKHVDNKCMETLHLYDSSEIALSQILPKDDSPKIVKQIIDEENLSLETDKFDLVLSSLSIHWINNLPGVFTNVLKSLKNDSAFLGAMFGGDTLYELRSSLQLAETERSGGVSPHISPFAGVSDVGGLLNRAGFTLLTLDTDEIIIRYPSMFELMYDLKGMGENNCTWQRSPHLRRDVALAASAIYQDMYGDFDTGIPATFQIIYFVGWKPDPSQPKPAPRGSQTHSFKDLNAVNRSTTK